MIILCLINTYLRYKIIFIFITEQPIDWDYLHVGDINVECENCFAFSPKDICGHKISDHNYYAICQVCMVKF